MKRLTPHTSPLFFCSVIIGLVLVPSIASAHLVTTGMGPVYDGIGHLLLTPEDLVPALAVAIYSGMLGVVAGRRAIFLLPLAWLTGGLAGLFGGSQFSDLLPALSFLVLGSLIAFDLRLPLIGFTLLTVMVGLFHGFSNGVSIEEGAGELGLIGVAVALFVMVTVVSAFIVSLQRTWTRIVVRVSGSWIVAIGMLMIGWFVRGRG